MAPQSSDRIAQRLKNISIDLKRYAEKKIELLAVIAADNYTALLAKSTQKIAGIILLAAGVGFLLIALAIFLGELLNSRSLGYVLVSIPLFVSGYLLYMLIPVSLAKKIKHEFDKDLVTLLDITKNEEEEALTTSHSQECLKDNKEKKYDG